jgi:ketosteroid isomerase-like protein
MNCVSKSLFVMASTLIGFLSPCVAQGDDVRAIEALFARYVALLNQNDYDTISTKTFSAPVLFLRSNGTHGTIPTPEAIAKAWASALANTKNMEMEKPQVCMLNASSAIAFVTYTQQYKDGTVKKNAWAYVLQKEESDWKAIALAIRETQTRMACE